jgi:3-dehydroquinate dehydratase-1
MSETRRIELRGEPVAGGKLPLVCAPLVGRTRDEVLAELAAILPKRPDLLEWRVDFFDGIGDTAAVVDLAATIQRVAGETPLLFTRRSSREGGEPIALGEQQVIELHRAVCASRCCDLVDWELGSAPDDLRRVREETRAAGILLVASFHDFERTPPLEVLADRFAAAERAGADIAKVAVMPRSPEDVLTLLQATARARRELRIPLISMSMGAYGSLTRLVGWVFGSAVTFAVGKAGSAPGQIPIEDVNAVIDLLQRSMRGPP